MECIKLKAMAQQSDNSFRFENDLKFCEKSSDHNFLAPLASDQVEYYSISSMCLLFTCVNDEKYSNVCGRCVAQYFRIDVDFDVDDDEGKRRNIQFSDTSVTPNSCHLFYKP